MTLGCDLLGTLEEPIRHIDGYSHASICILEMRFFSNGFEERAAHQKTRRHKVVPRAS